MLFALSILKNITLSFTSTVFFSGWFIKNSISSKRRFPWLHHKWFFSVFHQKSSIISYLSRNFSLKILCCRIPCDDTVMLLKLQYDYVRIEEDILSLSVCVVCCNDSPVYRNRLLVVYVSNYYLVLLTHSFIILYRNRMLKTQAKNYIAGGFFFFYAGVIFVKVGTTQEKRWNIKSEKKWFGSPIWAFLMFSSIHKYHYLEYTYQL